MHEERYVLKLPTHILQWRKHVTNRFHLSISCCGPILVFLPEPSCEVPTKQRKPIPSLSQMHCYCFIFYCFTMFCLVLQEMSCASAKTTKNWCLQMYWYFDIHRFLVQITSQKCLKCKQAWPFSELLCHFSNFVYVLCICNLVGLLLDPHLF